MNISYRKATSADMDRCLDVRGMTRDNAFTREDLIAIGVPPGSWDEPIDQGVYVGYVALVEGEIIAFCYGDTETGEILVLAVMDGYESRGIGTALLTKTSSALFDYGHKELWLAASATPVVRAHGYYRAIGWHPTGKLDDNGDEILTLNARMK
ncbi:GNAT family N-acetyltransferase [Alteromonas sp. ASW11-36]|uniref:GNAT family N-acetyltransferase n=1 Tax=Alteromonas arenosi TaxID=3055817 RepID=A0ABT7T1I4_9ALTE|nr:GNAT family N-acetyltransferase [Alteromonas sp. ASW11-36]MDM7862315.1 GNAT family N-acetyltransferase [Alteromonas sp. ASW11-36]